MRFVKGHGTENDFLVVPDLDGELDLTPRLVAALCDRRSGLGADGVLRVVRTAAVPDAGSHHDGADEVAGADGEAEWFMDYRNADGSVAEMCGNGVRVFARYLLAAGLAPAGRPLPIATRGGVRTAHVLPDGQVRVDMGVARLPAELSQVRVSLGDGPTGDGATGDGYGGREWSATGVLVPNPHAVAFVADLAEVGDLRRAPQVTPEGAFPEGVNVEFVVDRGPAHLALRVHERGVGETRSCGTGVCAAAVAAMRRDRVEGATYLVDVPGGRLSVAERPGGHVELTGPAVLVAQGSVDAGWLARAR